MSIDPLPEDGRNVSAVSRAYGGKRLFDLALAIPGLLVLSPFLLLLAGIVRLSMGSPVLFRQERPGLHGKIFTCFKFRTMREKVGNTGELLPDGARLTKVGRFLRASSLDELPELLNVIRGQMSLVGPRPLLIQYLELYNKDQARRHSVLPGITGWAQINGRNAIDWQHKFALDVWYVDHCTIWLDLQILFRTVWQVLARRGINAPGHDTVGDFKGNPGDVLL